MGFSDGLVVNSVDVGVLLAFAMIYFLKGLIRCSIPLVLFTQFLRMFGLPLVLIQYFPINLFFGNPPLVAFHCYDERRWTLSSQHRCIFFPGYNTVRSDKEMSEATKEYYQR